MSLLLGLIVPLLRRVAASALIAWIAGIASRTGTRSSAQPPQKSDCDVAEPETKERR